MLIRDAAYRRLLKATRADLHQASASGPTPRGRPRRRAGDRVAFHYEQAHRYRTELGTVDEETDRLGPAGGGAVRASRRAARSTARTLRRPARSPARRWRLPDPDVDERGELLLIGCECLLASGDVAAGAPLVDELDAPAGDNEQLSAVGRLLPRPARRAHRPGRRGRGRGRWPRPRPATLDGLGDDAGEAKARQVRAGCSRGSAGSASPRWSSTSRSARHARADDRRRVTAVLGAAPQAALLGPSPVARAGGRCLDVVRLLRITTASPAVEATSIRCQAVLEALRGRFDVSRSMLASARASSRSSVCATACSRPTCSPAWSS